MTPLEQQTASSLESAQRIATIHRWDGSYRREGLFSRRDLAFDTETLDEVEAGGDAKLAREAIELRQWLDDLDRRCPVW